MTRRPIRPISETTELPVITATLHDSRLQGGGLQRVKPAERQTLTLEASGFSLFRSHSRRSIPRSSRNAVCLRKRVARHDFAHSQPGAEFPGSHRTEGSVDGVRHSIPRFQRRMTSKSWNRVPDPFTPSLASRAKSQNSDAHPTRASGVPIRDRQNRAKGAQSS